MIGKITITLKNFIKQDVKKWNLTFTLEDSVLRNKEKRMEIYLFF